jgi:hypothetical protein
MNGLRPFRRGGGGGGLGVSGKSSFVEAAAAEVSDEPGQVMPTP